MERTPAVRPLAFDAIVLSGGRSSRMGTPKATLVHHGRPLVQRAIEALDGARSVVVAGPAVETPASSTPLRFVTEDPPHGGPVAGIAAALGALDQAPDSAPPGDLPEWVLVVAVDHPELPQAVPALLVAAHRHDTTVGSGSCAEGRRTPAAQDEDSPIDSLLVSHGGPVEWLLGIHRRAGLQRALAAVGDPHGCPVRRLFGHLNQQPVQIEGVDLSDVDTPEQARAFGIDPGTEH